MCAFRVAGWLLNRRVKQNGVTTLTTTVRYESREVRDAVLKSGMERGVAASYDRLAELLERIPESRPEGARQ